MSEKKYTPCGGCGATDPIQRCLGCAHPFRPIETPMTGRWVNLSENYTEDWAIMHCRFADDKYKLDTDLFEEKGGCLIKKGGTGAVRLSEVEYLIEDESPAEQPVAELPLKELSPDELSVLNKTSARLFLPHKEAEHPVRPTFWDVATAFKWVAEYRDEKGGQLTLYNDQWTLISEDEDGNENETQDLTPGNVAELYCLQKGFEKDEQPVREVDAESFAKFLDEQRSEHTANMWAEKAIWDKPNAFQEWLKYFKQSK